MLFFSPSVVFWLPSDANINFILSTIISVFIGLVVSMNMYYIFKHSTTNKIGSNSVCIINIRNEENKKNKKMKMKNSIYSLYLSPILAILSTGCISCSSSLGLLTVTFIASIMGVGTATAFASFISEYQIPIQGLTLALLGWSFVSINKAIVANSSGGGNNLQSNSLINNNNNNNNNNNKNEKKKNNMNFTT